MAQIDLPVAKYFQDAVTWRPGAPSKGNQVATFAEFIAIFQASSRGVPLICDQSLAPLIIPDSTDFDCQGKDVYLSGFGTNIQIEDGATAFRNFNVLAIGQGMNVTGAPTAYSPIRMTAGFSIIQLLQGGALGFANNTASAPMVEAASPSINILASILNGSFSNDNAPGVNVIHVASGCTAQWFSLQTFASTISDATVSGEPDSVLFYGSDAVAEIPEQVDFPNGNQFNVRIEKSRLLDWAFGDTSERPANPVTAEPRYNTQTQKYEYWSGSSWVNFNDFADASALRGWGINITAPTNGQALVFNGAEYVPTTVGGGGGDATSIQGTPVDASPPAALGDVLVYDGSTEYVARRLTLDDIDPAFNISSFSGGGGTVEIGATVNTPSFAASYTALPSACELDDSEGNPQQNLVSPFAAFASVNSYTKTANNATVTHTLTAHGATVKTANVSTAWRPRVYYGAAVPAVYNEAFIEGLATSALAANRNRSIAYNAPGTQKAYYAIPSSYGTPSFTVNGFPAAFSLVATVSVTNVNGVVQNYDLWASDLAGLGSFTAVVT